MSPGRRDRRERTRGPPIAHFAGTDFRRATECHPARKPRWPLIARLGSSPLATSEDGEARPRWGHSRLARLSRAATFPSPRQTRSAWQTIRPALPQHRLVPPAVAPTAFRQMGLSTRPSANAARRWIQCDRAPTTMAAERFPNGIVFAAHGGRPLFGTPPIRGLTRRPLHIPDKRHALSASRL